MKQLNWPGFNDEGTVLITLSPGTFCFSTNSVEIDGEYFEPKEELHVTLIGTKLGSFMLDQISHDRAIEAMLKQTYEDIDWSFEQTGPVHILSRTKGGVKQKSIILLIDMPGIKLLYDRLKTLGLIDLKTPVPPAHITLYTQNCAHGIGVPSDEALNELSSKTFSVNRLNELCKNMLDEES